LLGGLPDLALVPLDRLLIAVDLPEGILVSLAEAGVAALLMPVPPSSSTALLGFLG
jgi:hypothetical protein